MIVKRIGTTPYQSLAASLAGAVAGDTIYVADHGREEIQKWSDGKWYRWNGETWAGPFDSEEQAAA